DQPHRIESVQHADQHEQRLPPAPLMLDGLKLSIVRPMRCIAAPISAGTPDCCQCLNSAALYPASSVICPNPAITNPIRVLRPAYGALCASKHANPTSISSIAAMGMAYHVSPSGEWISAHSP